jgi:hexosaminidase
MRAAGYLLWPRTWAVSESVWTPKEKKNWPDFVARVENHFERWDIAKIKYSRSMYNPVFKASLNEKNQLIVELETEVPGLVVYYSFDYGSTWASAAPAFSGSGPCPEWSACAFLA